MKRYDRATLEAIYDILVRFCGASKEADCRMMFVGCAENHASGHGFEYRFQGALGFGGKVWLYNGEAPYVNCYQEDFSQAIKKAIAQADEALKALVKKYTE